MMRSKKKKDKKVTIEGHETVTGIGLEGLEGADLIVDASANAEDIENIEDDEEENDKNGKRSSMKRRCSNVWTKLTGQDKASADGDEHALRGGHQYQSLAELTRNCNNRKIGLAASHSSANAVLDKLSCSCFAIAVTTIGLVTLVCVVTAVVSSNEAKKQETDQIVAKIQKDKTSPRKAPIPKDDALADKGGKNGDSHGHFADVEIPKQTMVSTPLEVSRDEVKNDIAGTEGDIDIGAGISDDKISYNDHDTDAKTVDVRDEDDVERDDDDIEPQETKELLKAAKKMSIPRKVEANEDTVERKMVPLSPE